MYSQERDERVNFWKVQLQVRTVKCHQQDGQIQMCLIIIFPENLSFAFRNAGIYPFNSAVVTPEQVAPSLIYRAENVEQEQATESDADSDSTINYTTNADKQIIILDIQPFQSSAPVQEISENLFSARNITVVKQRPKQKFVLLFSAGRLLTKNNQDILKNISK